MNENLELNHRLLKFTGLEIAQIWGWWDMCGDFNPNLLPGERQEYDTDLIWCYNDDGFWRPAPNFLDPYLGIAEFFRWIAPKLGNKYAYSIQLVGDGKWLVEIEQDKHGVVASCIDRNLSIAAAKAVEQRIGSWRGKNNR